MANEQENQFDDTPTLEQMARLKPLVAEIQTLIGDYNLPVGNNTPEEDDAYFPAAEKILQMMVDRDIKFADKEKLFQLLHQSVDKLKVIVMGSLHRSFNKAMDIKWGIPFDEVGMKLLDETIKLSAKAEVEPVVVPSEEEIKDMPVA